VQQVNIHDPADQSTGKTSSRGIWTPTALQSLRRGLRRRVAGYARNWGHPGEW